MFEKWPARARCCHARHEIAVAATLAMATYIVSPQRYAGHCQQGPTIPPMAAHLRRDVRFFRPRRRARPFCGHGDPVREHQRAGLVETDESYELFSLPIMSCRISRCASSCVSGNPQVLVTGSPNRRGFSFCRGFSTIWTRSSGYGQGRDTTAPKLVFRAITTSGAPKKRHERSASNQCRSQSCLVGGANP